MNINCCNYDVCIVFVPRFLSDFWRFFMINTYGVFHEKCTYFLLDF